MKKIKMRSNGAFVLDPRVIKLSIQASKPFFWIHAQWMINSIFLKQTQRTSSADGIENLLMLNILMALHRIERDTEWDRQTHTYMVSRLISKWREGEDGRDGWMNEWVMSALILEKEIQSAQVGTGKATWTAYLTHLRYHIGARAPQEGHFHQR